MVERVPLSEEGKCPVPIYFGGLRYTCNQPARWRIDNAPLKCNLHAARVMK